MHLMFGREIWARVAKSGVVNMKILFQATKLDRVSKGVGVEERRGAKSDQPCHVLPGGRATGASQAAGRSAWA